MTLDRIASEGGPNIALLETIAARAGGRRVYAAGGIRHLEDLARIGKAGAAGALVASILHAQKFRPATSRDRRPVRLRISGSRSSEPNRGMMRLRFLS
jgi:uncharacterized protein related to proFAR isomerase